MKTTHTLLSTLLGVGISIMISGSALAEENHGHARDHAHRDHAGRHSVNAREHRQHERISQGAHSGQLTRDEAKGLRTEQRGIRQEEKQYRSDGKFTKEERKDVRHDQNQANKDIYKEKHDAETRK